MSALNSRHGFRSFFYLLFSLLLVSCVTTAPAPLQPVKSPSDDYQYRLLTLDNEMEVLLISDPDTPKAAASLDVLVGSGDNPPGRAGLAHFLEHMLFLGTDKYPDAAEYERFITEHGGSHNAYTSFENTNYFFDINAPDLPVALDRFAQFFIAPRFEAQYVDREKNAVEAEYQMGLKSDERRGLDVLQEVVNQDHPYSQFTVGSLQTLADRPDSNIRDELVQFYNKYYSANIMRLVVLGSQSLDELESLTRPLFSQVPNHSYQRETIEAPLFEPGELPLLVKVQPLATQQQLEVSFPVPNYRDQYRVNPGAYLGNLVGHEGEGSLLSRLKTEGLAQGLSAGDGLAWPGGALFSVRISLTEKGAEQPDRVLQLLFAYIDMLREEGPQRWLYDEQSRLADLAFRFREQASPMGYVSALASGMQYYAPEDILRGPYMMDRYDDAILAEMLAQLRPDNALVTLNDASVQGEQLSGHYQVPYSRRPLDIAQFTGSDEQAIARTMHLPAPNEFIAEDVSLVELPPAVPATPQVALESGRQTIWFMPDDEFRVPKGATYINFRSPEVSGSAEQTVQVALYAALLNDLVNEFAYPAHLAGMSFDIYKHSQGISLRLNGYNDKQALLLQRLLDAMVAPAFRQQRFDDIRDDMIRSLQNSVAKRPSSQVVEDLNEALVYGEWGESALIQELQKATLTQLERYIGQFWQGATAEVLIYGNYNPDEVEQVSAMLAGIVSTAPAPPLPERRVLKLAAGESLLYRVDVPHDDTVVAWYLQGADDGWKDRAATALTAQIMSSGFFQELRTQQQLGYVVGAYNYPKLEVPGLLMLVQSPVADANKVAEAMQAFMVSVEPALDEAQFERHKTSLISDILRPDKNLNERAEYYWQSIARKEWDFDNRESLADAVQALTLADWKAYYQQVFLQQRHSLQVVAPGKPGVLPRGGARVFDSAQAIKRDHATYLID
ncbi:MAG: insulinase family protein [Halioglobus sp.]|nr:insulinase family protein [Halioglobus sp.]